MSAQQGRLRGTIKKLEAEVNAFHTKTRMMQVHNDLLAGPSSVPSLSLNVSIFLGMS